MQKSVTERPYKANDKIIHIEQKKTTMNNNQTYVRVFIIYGLSKGKRDFYWNDTVYNRIYPFIMCCDKCINITVYYM